ncbi:hypothetical protein LLG46_05450 [bacterium]|nr:hypothetical protein [bacterium]
MRNWITISLLLIMSVCSHAATLVDIPLDQQIDIGLGDAITDYTSFESDQDGGFVRKNLTTGNGAAGYYWGPNVDLVKAGYGPYVDMSADETVIQYTARYCQDYGNTNPYADAPIFITLIDINGYQRGLGISYGPSPDPHYPTWITCTDDGFTAEWPDDDDFDLSRVVAINFWGTDWAGIGQDFIDIKNLTVLDSTVHNTTPVGQVKLLDDDETVEIYGYVSASFESQDCFYVQDSLIPTGIQVRYSGVLPSIDAGAYVSGTVQTDPDTGEMYIDASVWLRGVSGTTEPLCMPTRSLGGGSLSRQQGVYEGVGLNNVGLLVRIAGKITGVSEDDDYAYISDGSSLTGDGEYDGVKIDITGVPVWQRNAIAENNKAIVTGISSIYLGYDSNKHRTIRIRQASDLINLDSDGNEPRTMRVLAVNFDPICPGYDYMITHEIFGWNDPYLIAQGYIGDLYDASEGWCNYEIVDWFDADYHPYFEDGFQYSADDYVYAWMNRETDPMHEGTADYYRLISDTTYPHNQPYTIAERIANDEIDEVFFFGAPSGFAGWEAAMAGPDPFFVNGGTYTVSEAGRNFVMMGFNYERDVDCMLEDFCHRTECVMSHVYSPTDWWLPTWPVTNNWDAFRMYDQIEADQAACGICHYAPNSESDYDWGNTNYVWSTCDDWLYNWPNLLGDVTQRLVNCSEWGYGDMRLHHIWWLQHLPNKAGVNSDGKQNNWWKYSCDFNNYAESR